MQDAMRMAMIALGGKMLAGPANMRYSPFLSVVKEKSKVEEEDSEGLRN
jgi:hypothetical protein